MESKNTHIKQEAYFVICNLISTCDNFEVIHSLTITNHFSLIGKLITGLNSLSFCHNPVLFEILDALFILFDQDEHFKVSGIDSIKYQFEV